MPLSHLAYKLNMCDEYYHNYDTKATHSQCLQPHLQHPTFHDLDKHDDLLTMLQVLAKYIVALLPQRLNHRAHWQRLIADGHCPEYMHHAVLLNAVERW